MQDATTPVTIVAIFRLRFMNDSLSGGRLARRRAWAVASSDRSPLASRISSTKIF
jgi:hypothetical protein